MREIKFRVWDKDLKTMHVCGEDIHDSINFDEKNRAYYYNLQNGCGGYPEGSENEDNEYIMMQYTGLKDRSGKEIYEGDILFIPQWQAWYKVVFEDGMYKCSGSTKFSLATTQGEISCEVVGNIYENTELLEGGTGA